MFLENLILKPFSFNLFLIINFEDRITIADEIVDKKKRFFDVNILLSSYLHHLKINNILFLNISRMISYLFIYNFLKIRSCYLN